MRKLFTLITLFAGAVAATATDYTDELEVIINGESTKQTAVISVDEQGDGKYTLSLKNFVLMGAMPVGNIVLKDVEGNVTPEMTTIQTKQAINIEPGNMEGISEKDWMGPNISPVPVDMTAEIRGGKLYTVINIDMTQALGQAIGVVFGNGGYHMANSGFETFHTATAGKATSDEPDNWHSFMSCTGSYAPAVSTVPHTFISEEVRPGSTGSKSVLIKSGKVLGFIVANGTMTNGRLSANAMTADDTKNNAFIDITSEDTDANGDPFYTMFYGKPDSMSVWVKFTQGTPQAKFPYATVTAVITDGSYYQEPTDKDYKDIIVARAFNDTIKSNDGVWQKITMPFDYASYTDKAAKTILITFSTNAGAGEGSGNDELYVDDLELIYNCSATGISVKGNPIANFDSADNNTYEMILDGESADINADDIEVTTDGKGARVTIETVDVDCIGGGSDAVITVTSNDLKKSNTYVVKTRSALYAGINNASVNAGGKEEVKAIYNMNGQMVKTPAKGSICIVKYTNGKTVKKVVK